MPRGRPAGSKNKPKVKVEQPTELMTNGKPNIIIGKKETEESLITKMRYAYRRNKIYNKSILIARTIWGSGSYEAKNIMLAIRAAKTLVNIEER